MWKTIEHAKRHIMGVLEGRKNNWRNNGWNNVVLKWGLYGCVVIFQPHSVMRSDYGMGTELGSAKQAGQSEGVKEGIRAIMINYGIKSG